ncbi:restriction endonuclease [Ammoniphilus sp. CFH 90114]|uniref:restriction endonuclease n=1 Tax=Ammoniphilus sp. CFH 90114 TaxID=2493665 RepID=UPI0013E93323|nr:restriction endonuclease [Ammoniphilus sp. CFH 90114]
MAKRRRRRSKRKSNDAIFIIALTLILYVGYILYKATLGVIDFIDWIINQILNWTIFEWFLWGSLTFGLIFFIIKFKKYKYLKQKQRIEHQQKVKIRRSGNMERLKTMDPFDFEEYIAVLFKLMGYEEVTVTRKSGDGGKDIIFKKGNEICIAECKRYNSPKVTRPDVQKFHSALIDMNAKEGFYITIGNFTKPAVDYVLDKPIHLIDGHRLLSLIEEYSDEIT